MKKIFCFILSFITCVIFSVINSIKLKAHESMLDIVYDECQIENYVDENNIGDGINEVWYYLCEENYSKEETKVYYHLPHEKQTLKYYFSETSKNDSSYKWTTDISETKANEIKNAFANSMKQWNDVYFYSYDNYGNKIANKVIEIVEGTINDYDIIIYPEKSTYNNIAATNHIEESLSIDTGIENIYHYHYYKYYIKVNVSCFYTGSSKSLSNDIVEMNKKRAGAHEIGHILGLDDVDECCSDFKSQWHHEELLMGYTKDGLYLPKQANITYKDLAGVAITRGFHTDDDHIWLKDDNSYNGKYKLICSICNGVKYISSLTGILYQEIGFCEGNHVVTSENMMAVGCKGDKDYVKCKYCRYVCSVDNMELQNRIYQMIDLSYHNAINNVLGLSYTLKERHSLMYNKTDEIFHSASCICGYTYSERHSMTEADYTDGDNIGRCIQCKKRFMINNEMFPVLPTSITKYSNNGSFILSNGIIVLVEEDINSYQNNNLQFFDVAYQYQIQ